MDGFNDNENNASFPKIYSNGQNNMLNNENLSN